MQIYQYLHEIGLNEVLVIDENMGLCLYMYRPVLPKALFYLLQLQKQLQSPL